VAQETPYARNLLFLHATVYRTTSMTGLGSLARRRRGEADLTGVSKYVECGPGSGRKNGGDDEGPVQILYRQQQSTAASGVGCTFFACGRVRSAAACENREVRCAFFSHARVYQGILSSHLLFP
jgi:hypothetical protein